MKKCLVCGREVTSKRKDAKYCKDSACRKKAHLARKEEAAVAVERHTGPKSAVLLSFPDGSRWRLELTPLQRTEEASLPSLTQVSSENPENGSGSVPAPVPQPPAGPPPPVAAPQIRSEQILPAPPDSAAGRSELRTVELFFTDADGRRVAFDAAVQDFGREGWRVRRHVRVALGFHRYEGAGLGGSPGRWRDAYPRRSPADFGLDGDLGVLYHDAEAARAYAAEPILLSEVLGTDWRERLRAYCEEKMRLLRG